MHSARIVVLLGVFAACSDKKDEVPAAKTAPTEEKAPAKQPLTAAWFGKTVAPPGELAKLKLGSKKDDAKKALAIADSPGTTESEIADVAYAFQYDTTNTLHTTLIRFPYDKAGLITEAWGAGQVADRGGRPVTVWFNPDTGVRAVLSDEGGNRGYLRFEPYMPLVKLLGEGKGIAVLDRPFEGKTQDELKALYPERITQTGHVGLPATEWEFGGHTNLSPYPMDGPIESLAFSIQFNEKGKGEAEVMDVITKKWGPAKAEVPFGSVGGEKTHVYNESDPHIEVTGPGGYKKDEITIRIGGGDTKPKKKQK
jgi:hypothetical protein